MPIPDWAITKFRYWNDKSLLQAALDNSFEGSGYPVAVLQERQHLKHTYRRRKMLRKINSIFNFTAKRNGRGFYT